MRILEKAADFSKYSEIPRKMGSIPADRWGRASGGLVLPGVPLARSPPAEGSARPLQSSQHRRRDSSHFGRRFFGEGVGGERACLYRAGLGVVP